MFLWSLPYNCFEMRFLLTAIIAAVFSCVCPHNQGKWNIRQMTYPYSITALRCKMHKRSVKELQTATGKSYVCHSMRGDYTTKLASLRCSISLSPYLEFTLGLHNAKHLRT